MKVGNHLSAKTCFLLVCFFLCISLRASAAPSVEGDTKLTVQKDQTVTAEYTIQSDEDMEGAKLTLSYDKDALTYMSGSGGDNFSGSGGNGSIELGSAPGSRTAVFTVKFKGRTDGDTTIGIAACTITVGGQQVDVLTGESMDQEGAQAPTKSEESEEEESEERASFMIDGRTFYVRRPDDIEGFDVVHLDIQGFDCRVLKHDTLDLYVVRLRSDNGSYRDNFVYNPDTGNVIPFVEMESGKDDVIFIEPDPKVEPPTRYSYVDLGWGAKYTIPAYKHVIIDGIDEIFDDTNRYLIYGINQDGEKAWYSFDYDKDSLQLFDETAYQGEQNYITELEIKDEGLRSEAAHQLERYNTDMGRRLLIILVMLITIIVLINVVVLMFLRMKRMRMPNEEEPQEESRERAEAPRPAEYVTGSLEENETDFGEPEEEGQEELEIIDLDQFDNMEEED